MIIDTVAELFEHFHRYFDEIHFFDETENIDDTYYCSNSSQSKTNEEFLKEYGNYELVDFEVTNDMDNVIYVQIKKGDEYDD